MEYYCEKLIRCPHCGTIDVKAFEGGSWWLEQDFKNGTAPLPHYLCINRHIFSIGDVE